jgi:ATP-dependent DNA helicase PIF1
MIELDEIMRQRGDSQFAQLLCRVRTATCTEEDIKVLESRIITNDHPNYPHDALHAYPRNSHVDEQNKLKLQQLAPEREHDVIKSIDKDKDKHTQLLNLSMPENKSKTGGLVGELHLAIGAKVMLTVNVDVSDGLVNGARGTVQAIIKTGNEVTLILINFDHSRVGAKAIAQSQYRSQYPEAVPISRHEAVFCIGKNKAAEVSRRQFPLVLAWATTIHKAQGLTMDQIVVDMVDKVFDAGQAYVAFSRVKTLEGLFIKNFKPANIKVNVDVVSEMKRLSNQSLPSEPLPKVVTLPKNNWMKIGHLNVHSYLGKLEDIITDQAMNQANIMCFTETFLRPHQHVDHSHIPLQKESVVFMLDRLQASNEDLMKGGIMILCSRSLQPVQISIEHPWQLEVLSIMTLSTNSADNRMCIVVVYKRPQQPLQSFLLLLSDYISNLPQIVPTILLGDFNNNLLTPSSSSQLLQLMLSQLVQVPTTDSGSLLDHIYYNGATDGTFVDVVDTYYSDHATYLSVQL